MAKTVFPEDPNGKKYESDSEDEEEDPRIVSYETDDIAKILTINTIKKSEGPKKAKADDDGPSLIERSLNQSYKYAHQIQTWTYIHISWICLDPSTCTFDGYV
jgi:hypothetical protein